MYYMRCCVVQCGFVVPCGEISVLAGLSENKGRDIIYMQYNVVRCNAAVGKFI